MENDDDDDDDDDADIYKHTDYPQMGSLTKNIKYVRVVEEAKQEESNNQTCNQQSKCETQEDHIE